MIRGEKMMEDVFLEIVKDQWMKKQKIVRRLKILISICLSIAMLAGVAVPGYAAGGPDTAGAAEGSDVPEPAGESIVFSSTDFMFPENAKTVKVTINRTGDLSQERDVNVNAYDISADYDQDYILIYDDVEAEHIKDASSMFNAFRDKSVEVTREAEAASLLSGQPSISEDQEKGLAALEDIGAKATAIKVHFDAGQDEAQLYVKLIEDDVSEYDETFLLAITEDAAEKTGINTGLATAVISDDEQIRATNTIAFKSGSTELSKDEDFAKIYFERTGDLATISKAILYQGNEPYGYINFVPYQSEQFAKLPAGTYSLVSDGTAETGQGGIAITEKASSEEASKKGKEQDNKASSGSLDVIPDYSEYDARDLQLPDGQRGSDDDADNNTSWLPDWAKKSSYENSSEKVVMGDSSHEVFKGGGHSNNGRYQFLSGSNMVKLSTDGGDSKLSTSHIYADGRNNEDLTGYESVDTRVRTEDLQKGAKAKLGIYGTASYEIGVSGGNSDDITVKIPDRCHDSKYIYFENTDPSNWDDGCDMYFPNGYKLNKRMYLVQVDGSEGVNFVDSSLSNIPKVYTATGDASRQYVTIGNDTKIQVNLAYDDSFPVSLVGYKLKSQAGALSDTISLGSDHNIAFNSSYLKTYENNTWCFKTEVGGKEYFAFRIVPVLEKIKVDYDMEDSDGGKLSLMNSDKTLYKGDYAVFRGDANSDAWKFQAVDVYAKKAGSSEWDKTSVYPGSDGLVKVKLSSHYEDYRFQGIFSSEVNQITARLKDADQPHGKIYTGSDGVIVSEDQYMVNGYAALMAEPEEGYVTRWISNSRSYYGNTIYYQMDGNIKNDSFEVEFIPQADAGLVTGTLQGTFYTENVNLFDSGRNVLVGMSEKKYTIVSDKPYTGETDENGRFTIKDFTGVPGGTYTASIQTGEDFAYMQFVYNNDSSLVLTAGQFCNMAFYPDEVSAALNGANSERPDITLDSESKVEFNVKMKKAASDCEIDTVTLHFYRLNEEGKKVSDVYTAKAEPVETDATDEEGFNNHVLYHVSVATDQLPGDTYVYVEATGKKRVYYDSADDGELVTVSTGEADTGYRLKSQLVDKSLPVYSDVPYLAGAQEAKSVDWSAIQLDFLGALDMSLSGKGGGYFISQQAGDNTYYLVAGFSMTPYWGKTVVDNYDAARKTSNDLKAQEGTSKLGSTEDTAINTTTDTTGQTKGQQSTKSVKPVIKIAPTFMLKFTVRAYFDDAGEQHMYLAAFDAAVGADEKIAMNVPFNVYGVPFYVNISFNGQQYAQWEVAIENTEDNAPGKADIDALCRIKPEDGGNNQRVYLELSKMLIGVKGGVGYNNFVGAYLQATINPTLLVVSDDVLDAGGNITGSIGAGADMAIFNLQVDLTLGSDFGNKELADEIQELSAGNALKSSGKDQKLTNSDNSLSAGQTDGSMMDISAKMNEASFGIIQRTPNSGEEDSGTLIPNTFRGTDVQLISLGGNRIMAVSLQDNGAADSSYNYLSAVTSISEDGGKTWGKLTRISDSKLLQFHAKAHIVGDRILLSWSEGNMDDVLKNDEADKTQLAANEVGKALNAFDLKGRFFNMDGTPAGETFDIVSDASVSASILGAVEKDGKVYVYYQRCKYPEVDDTRTSDLLDQDRTISYAVINPEDVSTVSLADEQILATSFNGNKVYRIMEIEPFSYKGITGEILVIDRDGSLIKEKEDGSLDTSIDDRQVLMRIYNGTDPGLLGGTIIPLSDENKNAQDIHIESDGEHIYLFYVEDGEIMSYKDFVMTREDYDKKIADMKAKALVAGESVDENETLLSVPAVYDKETGEVEISEEEDAFKPRAISFEDESLTNATRLSTSMDDGGNVLLTWIGSKGNAIDETKTDQNTGAGTLVANEEVYGVVLENSGEDGMLQVDGQPVALTANASTLGHLDNLYVGKGDYLLAYSMLDGESIYSSKSASIKVGRALYKSDLQITAVEAPTYPTPGEEATVRVTVKNEGLKPSTDVTLSTKGIRKNRIKPGTDTDSGETDVIRPGESKTVDIRLKVPANMHRDIKLTIKASDSDSTSTKEAVLKYGSYFVPLEIPSLDNIANTKDFTCSVAVRNIGNKKGLPEVSYTDSIVGNPNEDAIKEGKMEINEKEPVIPGAEATLSGRLHDTLADNNSLVSLTLSFGNGYDQRIESVYPVLKTKEYTAAKNPDEEPGGNPDVNPGVDPVPAVTPYGPAKGKTFTSGNFKYKVTKEATNKNNGKVQVIKLSSKGKKASSLSVGTNVKIAGKKGKYKAAKYTITSLGKNVFKGAKAKKVHLSKKITKIPKGAFVNCRKLSKLELKAKLKKVSKNSFKGCKKKILVSGSSKKVNKANVKKLKKSGYKKFYLY